MRKNIDLSVKATTAWDSVHLYEAVDIASPSGLNKSTELDVTDPASKERLIRDNVTLFEVFKIGADYDDICYEWVNNYPITFDLAYPYLNEAAKNQAFEHCSCSHFPKNPLRTPRHLHCTKSRQRKSAGSVSRTQRLFWSLVV